MLFFLPEKTIGEYPVLLKLKYVIRDSAIKAKEVVLQVLKSENPEQEVKLIIDRAVGASKDSEKVQEILQQAVKIFGENKEKAKEELRKAVDALGQEVKEEVKESLKKSIDNL